MFALAQSADAAVAIEVNAWIAARPQFAQVLGFIAYTNALKTFPFLVVLVWAWHRQPVDPNRTVVLKGLIGALLAITLGRLLPAVLPFRERPIHDAALGLLPIPGLSNVPLDGTSTFPSDHGLLFGALVGLGFALSCSVGWALMIFAFLGIWLERVLLGYHFVSDIAVGCLLGAVCALAAQRLRAASLAAGWLLSLSQRRPDYFWTGALFFLIHLADMFNPARSILHAIWRACRYALRHSQ
jgi:undecaprenyl-diphosphatase